MFFSAFSVGSSASLVPDGFATQKPFVARSIKSVFYTSVSSEGVIEEILKQREITDTFINGADFQTAVLYSDISVIKLVFAYQFSDKSYVDGQSYRFSFNLNHVYKDVLFYFSEESCLSLFQIDSAMNSAINSFNVGDIYSTDLLKQRVQNSCIDIELLSEHFPNSENFFVDFTLSSDFSNTYGLSDEGDMPIIYCPMFIVLTQPVSTPLILSDVTLSPIGVTKNLYSDEFYYNGVLGGFEDLEDEMSDANEKLDDIIGSEDEGGIKGIFKEISELPSKFSSYISNLGDRIGSFFTQLKDNLLQGIKDLFIPTEEQITEFKNKTDTLLSEHLGVLYQAPNILFDFIRMLSSFSPLRSDDLDDYYIEYPSKSVFINVTNSFDNMFSLDDNEGVEIILIPSNTENDTYKISFGWLGDEPFSTFYSIYKAVIIFISVIGFCYYCLRKYDKLMGDFG